HGCGEGNGFSLSLCLLMLHEQELDELDAGGAAMKDGIGGPDAVNGGVVILSGLARIVVAGVKAGELEVVESAAGLLLPEIEEVGDGLGDVVVGGERLREAKAKLRIVARIEQSGAEVGNGLLGVVGAEVGVSELIPVAGERVFAAGVRLGDRVSGAK